ncbi:MULTISPECIES: IS66-like element accessory protein TnpA [Burkholderia]|uniref:IS66-like element accessory protein TnpA n=1 Tax=Burkholderia TaxID=32008 RepID=UPI001199DC5A|nr:MULTISPECIES: transposase [Burkholderia]TWC56954.1 transposase [Burkholderia sp. SJZ089]TWC92156.1 transposase [Burkholderia sp. SJZ115]TWC95461.1 transposase [Burkholderia sp. SJZ091]
MADKNSQLRVVRQSSDGRRRYDENGKRALVEATLRPGVSVARMAQEHGINANLLRKWITKYLMEREKCVSLAQQDNGDDRPPSGDATDSVAIDPPSSRQLVVGAAPPPAFVPVVPVPPASKPPSPSMTLTLHVHLSNGVELELGSAIATIDELTTLVQILGRMPCSGSTTI